jgi:hypothetical protein
MDGLNIFGLIHEASKELAFGDLENFWEELREKGMDDDKKLQGMFNKAKKIARQQDKHNDRKTVTGIVQGFLEG